MAVLAIQHVLDTGAAPSTTAPSASDVADIGNGHNTFLVYRNTGSTPLVLTIQPPGTNAYGVAFPAKTVTVPITTGEKWIPVRKDYDDGTGANTAVVTATGTAAGQTVSLVRVDW